MLTRLRSLLFTPGNRLDRVPKALAAGADAVILDLEDAVGAADKLASRAAVTAFFAAAEPGLRASAMIGVRVNSLQSELGRADLAALATLPAAQRPDFVVFPKAETVAEPALCMQAFGADAAATSAATTASGVGMPALIAIIESARGVLAAPALAAAPGVQALAVGGLDLCADLGCSFGWEPLLHARSAVVMAAASAGIGAVDMPWFDLQDDSGLVAECQRVRALGYGAKLAIHPRHVADVNAAFSPSAEERDYAQGVIAAFEAAAGNAFTFRGRMIDEPVIRSARRVLARS
jgi:citrate lyase beta subunit